MRASPLSRSSFMTAQMPLDTLREAVIEEARKLVYLQDDRTQIDGRYVMPLFQLAMLASAVSDLDGEQAREEAAQMLRIAESMRR